MQPQTLEQRVERLERRVTTLQQLPARMDALALQVVQLREEMHVEFSAVRDEMRAGDETVIRTLREEIRAGDEETRRQMRMLHEDVITRLALIQEGRISRPSNGRRKRR